MSMREGLRRRRREKGPHRNEKRSSTARSAAAPSTCTLHLSELALSRVNSWVDSWVLNCEHVQGQSTTAVSSRKMQRRRRHTTVDGADFRPGPSNWPTAVTERRPPWPQAVQGCRAGGRGRRGAQQAGMAGADRTKNTILDCEGFFQTWCDFFILVARMAASASTPFPEGAHWLTVESVESVELRHTVR